MVAVEGFRLFKRGWDAFANCDAGGRGGLELAREGFGREGDALEHGAAEGDEGHAAEWRVGEAAAEFHFLLHEALEIVVARELDRGTERREGLDDNLAFHLAAAGTAGDLGEELECALAGAEIGDV